MGTTNTHSDSFQNTDFRDTNNSLKFKIQNKRIMG